MSSSEPPSDAVSKAQAQAWTLRLVVALMLGGVVVGIAYMQRNKHEAISPRPPYITKIERDLTAIDQDGKPFLLSSMKGKVYLAVLFSTEPGITPEPLPGLLREAAQASAEREDFGVIAFSATPEKDTPEAMQAFLQRHGLEGIHFLTAEPEALNRYVKRYFRLYSTMPGGAGTHDARVVLVDRKANIRGYYRVLDPEHGEAYIAALKTHLTYVLDKP